MVTHQRSRPAFFVEARRALDVAHETSFKAKASKNVASIRSRRDVSGVRKRCVSECSAGNCAVARPDRASSHYPRRRGNRRRQLGDVLCLRQGKRRHTSGWRPARPKRLWRVPGLPRLSRLSRLWLPRGWRMRLWRLWLRLLCVVGSVPLVLDWSTFDRFNFPSRYRWNGRSPHHSSAHRALRYEF
jgi:hypothetical protein